MLKCSERTDSSMPEKKLVQIYEEYKNQIDAIASSSGMKAIAVGRIISWLYGGGTEHAWRQFLAKRGTTRKMPKEMAALLTQLRKK